MSLEQPDLGDERVRVGGQLRQVDGHGHVVPVLRGVLQQGPVHALQELVGAVAFQLIVESGEKEKIKRGRLEKRISLHWKALDRIFRSSKWNILTGHVSFHQYLHMFLTSRSSSEWKQIKSSYLQ